MIYDKENATINVIVCLKSIRVYMREDRVLKAR